MLHLYMVWPSCAKSPISPILRYPVRSQLPSLVMPHKSGLSLHCYLNVKTFGMECKSEDSFIVSMQC